MDPQAGPPHHDLIIGQTIGNYLVTQKLGEGGMGAVYLAEHPSIGKKVALKVLHSEFSGNQEVAARFFNEAKAVNDIGHPNIVDIVDFGIIQAGMHREQLVYFIMEYLAGMTLSGLIRAEAPLPPERALGIALQVADALAASHKCGIVHRDLKPDNIMLQQRGRERDFVKLLDFGIAKLTTNVTGSSRTRTGIVMGTPAYMSPEQCEGRGNIDHRTDIYALGILLYEMLVGRVPFIGEGYGEILVQHLTQPPTPPSQFRMLNPHVEAVVMKALQKRMELRYPTMDEMMHAMADPIGYVEANGGIAGFPQRQLMPSTGPLPPIQRLTPAPMTTPPPGMLTPMHGSYPAPTTLGAASGEVQKPRSKAGFVVLGVFVAIAAVIAVVLITTQGNNGVGSGNGSEVAAATPDSGTTKPIDGPAPTRPDAAVAVDAATPAIGSGGTGSDATVAKVSKITITTTPPNAKIFVNGQEIAQTTGQTFELQRSTVPVRVALRYDTKYDDIVLNLVPDHDINDEKTFVKKKKYVQPIPGKGSGSGKGSGTGRGSNDTGLERPGD